MSLFFMFTVFDLRSPSRVSRMSCLCCCSCFLVFQYLFFFFKQKTAYEMRISDWSSDVCSSDLGDAAPAIRLSATERTGPRAARAWPPRTLDLHARLAARHRPAPAHPGGPQQGRSPQRARPRALL